MRHHVDGLMGHIDPPSGMDLLPQLQGMLLKTALSVNPPQTKKKSALTVFISHLLSRGGLLPMTNQWPGHLKATWYGTERQSKLQNSSWDQQRSYWKCITTQFLTLPNRVSFSSPSMNVITKVLLNKILNVNL